MGRGQAVVGVEAPLQDVACEHFVSGVPSTVMGQTQLGNGESGTWQFAGVMGHLQLQNGESGTWMQRRRCQRSPRASEVDRNRVLLRLMSRCILTLRAWRNQF